MATEKWGWAQIQIASLPWKWRNPHSILNDFDKWFEHECRVFGLEGGDGDEVISVARKDMGS